MQYKIILNNKPIYFTLNYSKRKTIGIAIAPDLSVKVTAPKRTSMKNVLSLLEQKEKWVLKHLDHFEKSPAHQKIKQYIIGETHLYLGSKYILNIIQSNKNFVTLNENSIIIHTKKPEDKNHTKKLLSNWYKKQAELQFDLALDYCQAKLQKHYDDIYINTITIRQMKTQWGSCNPVKKKLTLNLELIKMPMYCIEYVVMHELCHYKHQNHSRQFYDFLESVMPDWKERKKSMKSS